MALVAAITDVGIAEAEQAQAGAFQISISSAQFSGDLITPPTTTHLQSLTFMTNVVYTAPTSQIQYHIVNSNTIMFRVVLPVTTVPASFNFGSYSLNLADGTPFAIGTWTSMQTKDGNSARYVELTIVFSNAVGTINLTILNTIDAALPEVADETQLPPAQQAPYPVYFVHSLNYYQHQPALASRFNNVWYYYPSKEVWYVQDIGSTNVLLANTPSGEQAWFDITKINVPIYIKVKNTNTNNVLFNFDGSGNQPVLNMDGSNIVPGQIVANSVVAVFYDVNMARPGGGTGAWQLLTSLARPARVRLYSGLNLYVAPAPLGNDSNDGLTAGTPFLHPQTAWNYIANNIDANGQGIQINIADGDYDSGIFASTMPLGNNAGITIVGNFAHPENVRITVSSGTCFAQFGAMIYQIDSMTLSAVSHGGDYIGGGDGVGTNSGGVVFVKNVNFGQCAQSHMDAEGGNVSTLGRYYTIVGGAQIHQLSNFGQLSTADGFVIVKGILTFTSAFALAEGGSAQANWNQQWGNNQIVSIVCSNVGSGLTDGLRTFTAYGGQYQAACNWTAQVSGGQVLPNTISIGNRGNYYVTVKGIASPALSGATTLSFLETSQIAVGMSAGHLNIPAGTKVQSFTSNTVTLDHAITGSIGVAGVTTSDSLVAFFGMPQMVSNPATVDFGASNATWDLSVVNGPKFAVSTASLINVAGAGIKYLPGSSPGFIDTATYGIYQ